MPNWGQRVSAWFGRLVPSIEPVEMCAQRFAYQPLRFRWRGLSYRVCHIEQVWERPEQPYRSARRYFSVRCHNQASYTLFHDLQAGTWHMVSAAVKG
jgi:hypothetical protein